MPNTRDYDKYAYYTIRLKRTGETNKALLDDAAEIGSKDIPTIASLRLGDYYKMKKAGLQVPLAIYSEEERRSSENVVHKAENLEANLDAAESAWD